MYAMYAVTFMIQQKEMAIILQEQHLKAYQQIGFAPTAALEKIHFPKCKEKKAISRKC
jgi:hypothetical protein